MVRIGSGGEYHHLSTKKIMNWETTPHYIRSRTALIDIRKLEQETNRVLALGFAVAIAVHAALFSLVKYERTMVTIPRPMQVELIIRPPRMNRPLIITEREFVRRELHKQYAQRMPAGNFKFKTIPPLRDIIRVPDDFDIVLSLEDIRIIIADAIDYIDIHFKDVLPVEFDVNEYARWIEEHFSSIEREPVEMLSLSESLLSIDDLDTGEYRGVVVKDPGDKQNVTGFVYIPAGIWGANTGLDKSQTTLFPAEESRMAVSGLAEGFSRYTGIHLKVDELLNLDEPELQEYPIVYISADSPFLLAPVEQVNLQKFFMSGGFALLEPFSIPGLQSIRQMLVDTLGDSVKIEEISEDHPILHCFYDFENPTIQINGEEFVDPLTKFRLDGIFLYGDLMGLLLSGDYGSTWGRNQYDNPYFRVAVNAIVYSLIKEGSLAKQYINLDAYGG
ncbi:DUF4159 domain-containing protein [Candidatus Latescibacterota bacterium]